MQLRQPLAQLPTALAGLPLQLSADGQDLIYTFDTHDEHTGIAEMLRRLNECHIDFTDLQTRESSLEDIFVNLMKGPP